MFRRSGGYFGTLIFAHVGVGLLHLALQASAIYNWLSSHAFLYWLVYAVLAVGFLLITAQESINQGGRDAQELQGCIDRGEDETAQRQAYRAWYGLVYALVLEVPVILLSILAAYLEGMAGIVVGLIPNLWYAAWQPLRELLPNLFPVLFAAIGALTVAVAALVYPEGRRRYGLMRQHMLENTERLRNREKPIRIPRGK